MAAAAAAPAADLPFALPVIEHLGRLRWKGQTWDQLADEAKKPYRPTAGDRLRDQLKDLPEWKDAVREARREAFTESLSEALFVLRCHVRDKDPVLAARVANDLARVGETRIRR